MSRVGIREQLDHLIDALDPDFVVSRGAAQAALLRRAEFNAIHRALIFKVDFWFSTGDEFDTSRLAGPHRSKSTRDSGRGWQPPRMPSSANCSGFDKEPRSEAKRTFAESCASMPGDSTSHTLTPWWSAWGGGRSGHL